MRFLARKKRRQSEATVSRIRAERELEKTRAETPAYAALGESLRKEIREANHLTELFLSIRRGEPT